MTTYSGYEISYSKRSGQWYASPIDCNTLEYQLVAPDAQSIKQMVDEQS